MRIYGLTGGTGSGKSEAARCFEARGFAIIDADAIGHEVIAKGGAAERQVIEAFGDAILTDGHVDRVKLGELVFRDQQMRQRLNSIVHPAIGMSIALRCAALADAGQDVAIIDAALIAENGRKDDLLSGLIVVTCPVEERVRRLVRHRGIAEAEALRRIAAQTPPENKLALADWVIENTGSKESLCERVAAVAKEIRQDGG